VLGRQEQSGAFLGLMDGNGMVRAQISSSLPWIPGSGGSIFLQEPNIPGERVRIVAEAGGANVILFNRAGQEVSLSAGEGHGGIRIGAESKPGILMSASETFALAGPFAIGPSGKQTGVVLSANSERGGNLGLNNKTGDEVVQIHADEYGDGVVGTYNRQGMGRTLQPGP